MKSDDFQDAIGFGQVTLRHSFEIRYLASSPGIDILLCDSPHLKEDGQRSNLVFCLEKGCHRPDYLGVELVFSIRCDGSMFHLPIPSEPARRAGEVAWLQASHRRRQEFGSYAEFF